MYNYKFSKNVEKFLEKQDLKFLQNLLEKIQILCFDPYKNNLDVKFMTGSKNDYRLRIGKYRFLYSINHNEVLIYFFDAGSRGDVYK